MVSSVRLKCADPIPITPVPETKIGLVTTTRSLAGLGPWHHGILGCMCITDTVQINDPFLELCSKTQQYQKQ